MPGTFVFLSDECEDSAHPECALIMCECTCHDAHKRLSHDLRQTIAILILLIVVWGILALLMLAVFRSFT